MIIKQFCNCIIFISLGLLVSCGGGGSSNSGPAPAPNSAPYFIGLPSEISVVENQTDLITASAQDDDGDSLTFSLSGTDKDYFNITNIGVISFITAPSYATKPNYFITVNVTDGEYTASGSLTINIFIKENCDSSFIVEPTNGYDLMCVRVCLFVPPSHLPLCNKWFHGCPKRDTHGADTVYDGVWLTPCG